MRGLWLLSVLAVATRAAAEPSPVAIKAKARGSAIDLTFTNKTKEKLSLPVRIKGEIPQYDWLTVRLSAPGNVHRTLKFALDRDKSYPEFVDLAAGASTTETIDLAQWAFLGDNGDPLEEGTYQAEVTWDATRETSHARFKETAKTKITIESPVEKRCKDTAHTGLVLFARQIGKDKIIAIGIHNSDTKTHCVNARINAGDTHSDWLQLAITDPKTKKQRVLRFSDDRDESALVVEQLPPGATSWTLFNLSDWAKRKPNGGAPLPRGTLSATATYDTTNEKTVWSGKLQASFALKL